MTERTPSPPFDPHGERIRFEQIDALYRNATIGVLGALAAAFVLGGTLVEVDGMPVSPAARWLACGCACVGYHLLLVHAFRRARRIDIDLRPWAWAFVAGALADGAWWGYSEVAVAGPERVVEQSLLLLTAFTVASGAVPAFGSYLPAFYAIFFPITSTALGWNLAQGGAVHYATAIGCGVLMVTMIGLARIANANFNQTLRLRFEKDALAEELRRQKERAEEANLSKSRFLAAASHDLRQPIHALGMFVGALGDLEMNEQMRRLVASMEASIAAMDGLFSSLLDISKLDAGIVEPDIQSFAIGPLIRRICLELEGEALKKPIALEFSGCALSVRSDPVLLERILRNIVSNAIRYTDHGRVLVGCRRGGDRLRIQVWDTGRGIARGQFERIFEEFYQIDNPGRDREKGLGLGLAIVRRLTELLEHPLSLRSTVGRGSVFTVSVPVAAGDPTSALAPGGSASPVSLEGLVLVVDDEALIRNAMRSLLSSWGFDVIVAGSGDEMLERIASCRVAPDVIVCDYRLRDEENGMDVIRRLQAEYNDDIPAVLITGDTSPERLREARDSGFVVLNKPVANSKLRATLGNLAAKRQRAQAE